MAAYPVTLPKPVLIGSSFKPRDKTIRTEMDSGTARVRKRFTTTPTDVDLPLSFDDTEFEAFKAWFDDPLEVDGGTNWFWITFVMDGGGEKTVEARFVGPYKWKPRTGDLWDVTAKVEIRNA